MTETTLPIRPARPVLRHDSFTGGSFIQSHQQYKPSSATWSQTLSDVVDSSSVDNSSPRLHNENPISPDPSRVKDSGIVHSIFGQSVNTLPADTPRLVATIFYKTSNPLHPSLHPDNPAVQQQQQQQHQGNQQQQSEASLDNLPAPTVQPGSAPSLDIDKLPREPPAPEPEPLDHIYGPYVSQLCLTQFLQIMESLNTPYHQMNSSHRCLDKEDQPNVVEVTFWPPPNPEYLSLEELSKHESIWRFEREWNVEVVLQRESVYRRYKRLAIFDMDSTLILQEVIDEIAKFIGVEKEVSEITERAMNGELDFSESLKERVTLLKGVPADVFDKLKSTITIAPGARELCRALKRLGFKMAVLSGGFQPLADWLAGELGLDYAYANHLETDPTTNTLTGTLSPSYPIVDAAQKRTLLRSLAEKHEIPISQTMAVGDGANDLLMLKEAGLGVAWRAKSKVQMEAPTRLNGENLVEVLYLLGVSAVEARELGVQWGAEQ